eukprot:SAG22_NODE_246_length_13948_cov_12.055744_11_plen_349_part_00
MMRTALLVLGGCTLAGAQSAGHEDSAAAASQTGDGSCVGGACCVTTVPGDIASAAGTFYPDDFTNETMLGVEVPEGTESPENGTFCPHPTGAVHDHVAFDEDATLYTTIALNDTHHMAWDGDVVEYVDEGHHISYEDFGNGTLVGTTMTNEEHNITFLPGGPAGTMALNHTHHLTPDGTVIEELNETHHYDPAGFVTAHVDANLTREYHELTDEHLDAHADANEHHALFTHYAPPRDFDCNRMSQTRCLDESGMPNAPCVVAGRPCESDDVVGCYYDDCNPPAPLSRPETCDGFDSATRCDIRAFMAATGDRLANGPESASDLLELYCACFDVMLASRPAHTDGTCGP